MLYEFFFFNSFLSYILIINIVFFHFIYYFCIMKKLILNEYFILGLILINSVIIFISGYTFSTLTNFLLHLVDNIITLIFVLEIIIKIKNSSIKDFFKHSLNTFDFILVVCSIPALLSFIFHFNYSSINFLLAFRLLRIFKIVRLIEFIPNINRILNGLKNAMKSSVFIMVSLIIYIFILGIISFNLFNVAAPDYFSTPLNSLFTIFQIFTIEGWQEIPKHIVEKSSVYSMKFVYGYFSFILVTGGIFGLSIVNSIFVDAMVSDNNDELLIKIDKLESKIDELLKDKK